MVAIEIGMGQVPIQSWVRLWDNALRGTFPVGLVFTYMLGQHIIASIPYFFPKSQPPGLVFSSTLSPLLSP